MRGNGAFGVFAARLNIADAQPRGARCDNHMLRREAIELRVDRLFERKVLGHALLHEIGIRHCLCKICGAVQTIRRCILR